MYSIHSFIERVVYDDVRQGILLQSGFGGSARVVAHGEVEVLGEVVQQTAQTRLLLQ